jgi:glycosyltransferase involved in cell wall biosynthesis
MVLHDPSMNGASIATLRAVPTLVEMGWRFCFWTPAPGSAFEWLRERGAQVSGQPKPVASSIAALREPPGLPRRVLATPGYMTSFARFLKQADPEVVHANSLFSFAEAMLAKRLGRPTMFHVHDMAPSSWKVRAASAICRRGVDHTIAVSEATASFYSTDEWSPDVVYESTPIPETAATTREEPKPFVVGTVGVVAPRKGSDTFVSAARTVLADRDDIEFRMVGSPDDPLVRAWGEQVIAEAKSLGIVHMPRADVLAEIRSWDLFVLPSRGDPCPLVMLEAMASGIPVVGARSGGITEQVTPECGLLVDPESPSQLAEAIEEISELPASRRREMGAEGRLRAKTVFGIERQAEGIAGAYEKAIHARAAR